MAKQYKPGQFVWMDGKQHRVTKTSYVPACSDCPYGKELDCPSAKGGSLCLALPNDCYPKPVNYG